MMCKCVTDQCVKQGAHLPARDDLCVSRCSVVMRRPVREQVLSCDVLVCH